MLNLFGKFDKNPDIYTFLRGNLQDHPLVQEVGCHVWNK